MTAMTFHPDDLLSRTRAQCHADAPVAGLTRDQADTAWLDTHRHGRIQTHRETSQVSREGDTIKFTLTLEDGHEAESVILPMTGKTGRPRTTLCLSSQVGCALGCVFCETGAMGLVRNLSVPEIIDQWHVARFRLQAEISNIVFMGMGEPMENLDAVLASIEILAERSGAGIPASRISVSTAGRVDGIDRYRAFMSQPDFGQVRLAVSVNAPNEDIRTELMPITKADSMDDLKSAMDRWTESGGRPILVEYVLIPGVNDDTSHPRMLADWLGDLPCRINVIPYNPRRDSPWPAPSESTVERFVASLRETGSRVHRRRTMGRDVMAACGQLGNAKTRRRVPLRITSK